MKYAYGINPMGSWSIYQDPHKPGICVATAYSEGMAIRICRLLNESEEDGQ